VHLVGDKFKSRYIEVTLFLLFILLFLFYWRTLSIFQFVYLWMMIWLPHNYLENCGENDLCPNLIYWPELYWWEWRKLWSVYLVWGPKFEPGTSRTLTHWWQPSLFSFSKPERAKNISGDATLTLGIETSLTYIVQLQFHQLLSHTSVRILMGYYRHHVRLP
jgi:hypothetical protein